MKILDYPLLGFAVALSLQVASVWIGANVLRRERKPDEANSGDFSFVLTGSLTLLTLIIGFTFSLAAGRFDQRENLEAAEANAIGTEYVRADLLPAADAVRVRALLRDYTDQRILFYTTRDQEQIRKVNERVTRLQTELWATVNSAAGSTALPAVALAVSGMNEVLDSQGYSQAAWWNRVPVSAWVLMAFIAISCNLMMGYRARNARSERVVLHILPLLVSVAFFLIADIDSPRSGIIRVRPQSLVSLAESLRPQ